jgi:S-adenosylmethionine hydrolase
VLHTLNKPIILVTDFGYKDPYVGVMKLVIESIAPGSIIIDLTHGIPSFDITAGAYVLYTSYHYFPSDSITTIVVDPGVGSSRSALIAKGCNGYFIGPDNGVLYPVLETCENPLIGVIDYAKITGILENKAKWIARGISKTFHGRDVFAPAAALISQGYSMEELVGMTIGLDEMVQLSLIDWSIIGKRFCAKPIYIDKFGNIVLSSMFTTFEEFIGVNRNRVKIFVDGNRMFNGKVGEKFSDVEPGEILVYSNSSGFLEIAVNKGSAEKVIGKPSSVCLEVT